MMYRFRQVNVLFSLSLFVVTLFNVVIQELVLQGSGDWADPFSSRRYLLDEHWTQSVEESTESIDSSSRIVDSFKALSDQNGPPFSVFYNIFVPPRNETHPNRKYIRNAEMIVHEQLDQIGRSYANSIPGKQLVVFYNTVGLSDLNTSSLELWCRNEHNMRCQRMQHYDQAFEDVTLSRVHEYCQVQPDHRVIYLHSKGSYHPRPENRPWRRGLTYAATSQDCLEPPDDKCNVCGLQFFPVCSIEFPGNMWTASCDYVRRLLPPQGFEKRVEQVYKEALESDLFTTNFRPYMDICAGTGRYAAEHWIGSHPFLQPCDISVPGDVKHWFSHKHQTYADLSFSSAPRRSILDEDFQHGKFLYKYQHWMKNERLRLREYLFLPGNLFRWFRLYGEAPPRDSWVWKWFPDGKLWQDAVNRRSENALQAVLERLPTPGNGSFLPLRGIQKQLDDKAKSEGVVSIE